MSNITLNAGTGGATLGTDTVTAVDYQIVKIGFSVAGAAPVQVSASNALPVVQTGALPAGANVIGGVTQSGTWAVTANIGTTGTLALDASVTGLQVAQGSTTSGQKGGLALGAVTTAAPTYTTAQSNPLSLTTAGALRIDGSAVTQPVSGTFWQATQPVSGTVAATQSGAWSLSANQSVNVAQLAGTTTDTNSGNKSAGTLRVVLATDQPTMSNGQPAIQSGTWTVQPGNTANTTPWLVTDTPGTSGGLSFSYVLSAASNNKTQAKGSAGQLFTVVVTNTNAAARYLKIFNNTSAGVTMGTTNADFQFVIPGNTAGAGIAINIDKGIAMGTGITYAITAGVALNDNTSVAANEVSALLGYK